MPDYSNGKIYKVTCDSSEKIYIGSTCLELSKRFNKHIVNHKNWKLGLYRYVTIFALMDTGFCNIQLIENYPCKSYSELLEREQYYQDLTGDMNINDRNAFGEDANRKKQYNKERDKLYIVCECKKLIKQSSRSKHYKSKIHQKYLDSLG